MNKIINKRKWLLLPLFALATIIVLTIFSTYTKTDRESLFLTPVFEDNMGWEIYTLENNQRIDYSPFELLSIEPFNTFYLTRILTSDLEEQGYTLLSLDISRPCSVFLDDELLYTTSPMNKQQIGEIQFPPRNNNITHPGESIICTLPSNYANKTLTIATAHEFSEYGPSTPGVILSDKATESSIWMANANRFGMPAAAFAVAALLLLGLLFYSFFQGERNYSLLLLGATAFIHVFYYLREYAFSSLTFSFLATVWATFLPTLIIILPCLFLVMHMKRWQKLGIIFTLLATVISLIPPVMIVLGLSAPDETIFLDVLYIALGVLLICSILEAKDKNYVFQLFLGGLSMIIASILVLALYSLMSDGIYLEYLMRVFQTAWDMPVLFQRKCGTILFALSSMISVFIIIHNTVNSQMKLVMQEEKLDRLNYDTLIQKQFYEARLTSEEELKALRHDMLSHLSTISTLLSDDNISEAKKYLEPLKKQHSDLPSEIFCSNPYINAVLKTFSTQFQENDITFTCQCGIECSTLPGMEICLILNNALQNALEASLLIPISERYIKVQATIRKNQLLFRISNHFNGTLNKLSNLPSSTKEENGHGYGLKNIQTTSRQLGGDTTYKIENKTFILDVRLPLTQDIKKT